MVAYLFGKLVEETAWQELLGRLSDPTHRDGEEDFVAPVSRGSLRAITVPRLSGGHDTLLASEHCLPRAFGIEHTLQVLHAGDTLTAPGGFAHFGFSTSPGKTVSIAANSATDRWLKEGGAKMVRKTHSVTPDNFTCSLVRGLRADLGVAFREDGSEPRAADALCDYPNAQVK